MNEGVRYLGVYITGDRTTKPMENILWEKAIRYTSAFQKTPMTHREAGVLYRSCFLPALTYPLPATWLPDRFFAKLHRLSTSTILNKMGFHKNLPHCMVFAPRTRGGVGLQNLQHEMENQQIMILLRHLRAQTQLGTDLTILIRTYQLWAGLSDPILVDTRPCSWVPDCWLSRIRRTLYEHRIQIKDEGWTIPAIRQFDVHLMEAIVKLQLTPTQLVQINACRMYLKVTMLVEITDHTGTMLLPQVTLQPTNEKPMGLEEISHSVLEWPVIHLLSRKCWKLWTRTIRSLFMGTTEGMRLCNPLGPWRANYQLLRFWKWRISPLGSLVHQAENGSPTKAALQTQSNRRFATFSLPILTNQPFLGSPVTPLDKYHRRVDLPIVIPILPAQMIPPVRQVNSFTQQFRSSLQPWQRPLFGPIQKLQHVHQLQNLRNNEQPIAIVSNASLQKDHRSGFAWVITNQDRPLWQGVGLAPGNADDMHSGRAEAFGVLAALIFLSHYIQSYGPHLFLSQLFNATATTMESSPQ